MPHTTTEEKGEERHEKSRTYSPHVVRVICAPILITLNGGIHEHRKRGERRSEFADEDKLDARRRDYCDYFHSIQVIEVCRNMDSIHMDRGTLCNFTDR